MIDAELLAKFRCPETYQELRRAEPALLTELNRKLATGGLKNRGGEPITGPLEEGLIRADGRVFYPIIQDIPHLLVEKGIFLEP